MFLSGQVAVAALIAVASAAPFLGTHCTKRQDLASSYDYVVVGGGASGLTLANRLSEDSCEYIKILGHICFGILIVEILFLRRKEITTSSTTTMHNLQKED